MEVTTKYKSVACKLQSKDDGGLYELSSLSCAYNWVAIALHHRLDHVEIELKVTHQ